MRTQLHFILVLTRQDIVDEARKWMGTPFRHQGRAASGIDCCGLVIRVANDLDVSDYDTTGYSRRTTGEQFINHFRAAGLIEKPVGMMKHGDVILTRDGRFPCHCGFVVDRGKQHWTIIHAYARKRAVVESTVTSFLSKAVAVFEFPEVA